MAVRADVHVRWALSPRIIVVEAPSAELIIQDLVDTVRDLEDELINLEDPKLLDASGKEALGGGTKVGITATLLDAVIEFEARKTWAAQGSVTTPDVSGQILTDAGASFTTTVQPGYWVVNFTDGGVCSVIRVISDTQLLTDELGGGADNQWDGADDYRILPVVGCTVSGGNVVAVDKYGVESLVTLPTAGTQIIVARSVSATTQELTEIQYASYDGGVTIDVTSPYSGTAYPVGTRRCPVNNPTDALAIMLERGFHTLYVEGALTVDAGLDYSGRHFYGHAQTETVITITAAANVAECKFHDAEVNGVLDGGVTLQNCEIEHLEYVDGMLFNTELEPPLIANDWTIRLSGAKTAYLIDCFGGATTHTGELHKPHPTIDMGDAGSELAVRGYRGTLKLINKTGPEPVTIDLDSGVVYLDATIGGTGTITIRGVGNVVIDPLCTATVNSTDLLGPQTVADAVWDEPAAAHVAPGSFGELEAGLAQLSAQQIALIRLIHRFLGLDPVYVRVDDEFYIRVPADGSLINIAVTKIGTASYFQRL